MGVMSFVVSGALGFGLGWVVVGSFALTAPMWPYFLAGACGGAGLGLALGDRKRIAVLALAGSLGFGLGSLLEIVVAVYTFGIVLGGVTGMVGGAALGLVLGGWRRTVVLGLVGFVGFGLGETVVLYLQPLVLDFSVDWARSPPPLWRLASVEAIGGLIGGASLGAALGYLERRRSGEEGPRVR